MREEGVSALASKGVVEVQGGHFLGGSPSVPETRNLALWGFKWVPGVGEHQHEACLGCQTKWGWGGCVECFPLWTPNVDGAWGTPCFCLALGLYGPGFPDAREVAGPLGNALQPWGKPLGWAEWVGRTAGLCQLAGKGGKCRVGIPFSSPVPPRQSWRGAAVWGSKNGLLLQASIESGTPSPLPPHFDSSS